MQIIKLYLPEYVIETKPDYEVIGRKIDKCLTANFYGKNVAIRALSMRDHPQLTIDEFAGIILETGTDKYDPQRKGVAHKEFESYHADIQATPIQVGINHVGFGSDMLKKFYENALLDRGYRLRIDLLVIYDLKLLVAAKKDTEKPGVDPRLEKYLFRFKNPAQKQKAVVGIIKIL